MAPNKFDDVNLYELIGVEEGADQKEIRRAYRKKALQCHPDKNPENPAAAELFHGLSRALAILTDAEARSAYDKVLKAKKAAELRNKQLDSKRKKLKSDLEEREQAALHKTQSGQAYSTVRKSDEEILKQQIERLRREGSKLLEEEKLMMRNHMIRVVQQSMREPAVFNTTPHRVRIKWKADRKDPTNGGYTQQKIINYLKKYGEILAIVMSKKNGGAIVEFQTREAGELAVEYEMGQMENPLKVEWLEPAVPKVEVREADTTSSPHDFEDLVLRKMRQAEERKRLIDEINKEEEGETVKAES